MHVRQNDVALLDAAIDCYGGDPAFHAVEGSNPSASYHATLTLQPGDVLSFDVGYGVDQTNYNDTTGLFVHIEQVQ